MRITVEISMYPLHESFVTDIREFIQDLRQQAGVEVLSNQMSTQIRGEFDDVTSALNRCMRSHMEKSATTVFVTKFLNADLPIADPPAIEQ